MVRKSVEAAEQAQPNYSGIEAHYDPFDRISGIILGEKRLYSCAYFPTGSETIEQAQDAKMELTAGKLDLQPGERVLDIGCGWGGLALYMREKYNVEVVGLTVSKNQYDYVTQLVEAKGITDIQFVLEGWKTYKGSFDKIVSVGAFEHFKDKGEPLSKLSEYFAKARSFLPKGGIMNLHTITLGEKPKPEQQSAFRKFSMFILNEIFTQGSLTYADVILDLAKEEGWKLVNDQGLRTHYARTLQEWDKNLIGNSERVIELTDRETYERNHKYFTECAYWFDEGQLDVHQFLFRAKPLSAAA